jgi:membrane protein
MTIYYFLLIIGAMLFAGQFLLTKQFQNLNGDSVFSSVKLLFFAYLTIAVFFFGKACIDAREIKFGFSVFTLIITLCLACDTLVCIALGAKVLGIGNMSTYSVFMMIGSIVLPTLTGVIFYKEELTLLKAIAIVLMLVSVLFINAKTGKEKTHKKAILYYVAIFILNGMIGVLFAVYQNHPLWAACYDVVDGIPVSNSDVFMSWYGISTTLLSGAMMLWARFMRRKKQNFDEKDSMNQNSADKLKEKSVGRFWGSLLIGVGYGLANGFGNYFISISTAPVTLGSSVAFPIVNGGTILFSTLLGFIVYKEKISLKTTIGLVLVLISTVLFMFV